MHGLCINEKVAGEQFVETMQGMFPTAVADLLAALDENPAWTLDEKYEFVLRRARIREQMKKMASDKTNVSLGSAAVVQDVRPRTVAGLTGGVHTNQAYEKPQVIYGKGVPRNTSRDVCFRCGAQDTGEVIAH